MTVPGVGNEPEGDSLKGSHKGWLVENHSLVPKKETTIVCGNQQGNHYVGTFGIGVEKGAIFLTTRIAE